MIPSRQRLRIGTRGSQLALKQTERVVERIQRQHPHITCDVQVISTAGDRDKKTSLTIIGGHGVFAKELQAALLNDEIDLAVHSVKDLTSTLPDGLDLATILDRSDPRDVIISPHGALDDLPVGSVVGTSSRRRVALIKRLRPDLAILDLRGNIDTRIGKVRAGDYDAAVLAAAGVCRMGWEHEIRQYLDVQTFVPAPGQGALGIEIRKDDRRLRRILEPLNEPDTALAIETERLFLRTVGGGCTSPIGAIAEVQGESVRFTGMLATEDLAEMRIETRAVARDAIRATAIEMAERMVRDLGIEVQAMT